MSAVKMGLTIEEAAECTGIGRNTMRKLVEWGKLPVLKVGRKTIIRRDTLERFLTVNSMARQTVSAVPFPLLSRIFRMIRWTLGAMPIYFPSDK